MYKEEHEYYENINNFYELLILVKIDKIKYRHLNEEETLVSLCNSNNKYNFEFKIPKKENFSFLLTLCMELVKEKSDVIKASHLPDPCTNQGSFVLSI